MKTLNALDFKKAREHDNIIIWMLKICGASISSSPAIIFKNCLNYGKFVKVWKKVNLAPIHKKDDKSLVKKLQACFSFANCGEVFETLICKSLYSYVTK